MSQENFVIKPLPRAKADDIVFLIHGTFASNAKWIDHHSILATKIQERIPGISVRPFRWSGQNSYAERSIAADELAKTIKNATTSPQSRVHLIGHSHGGNVALLAMKDENANAAVTSISFLGTPFFSFRPRSYETAVRFYSRFIHTLMFPLILCCTLLLPVGLAYILSTYINSFGVVVAIAVLPACFALQLTELVYQCLGTDKAVGSLFTNALTHAQEKMAKIQVALTKPAFVAWVEGDEARLWLSSLNIISNLPLRLVKGCLSLVSTLKVLAALVLTALGAALIASLFASDGLAQHVWAFSFFILVAFCSLVVGLIIVLLTGVFVATLFSVVVRSNRFAFGWEGLLGHQVTDISVVTLPGSLPQGSVQRKVDVTQLGGLRHSRFYASEALADEIAQWLSGEQSTQPALSGEKLVAGTKATTLAELAKLKWGSGFWIIVFSDLIRWIEFLMLLVLAAAILNIQIVDFNLREDAHLSGAASDLLNVLVVPFMALISFELLGLYKVAMLSLTLRNCLRIVLGWSLAWMLAVSAMRVGNFSDHYSPQLFYILGAAGLVLLLSDRSAIGVFVRYMNRNGLLERRVAIIGNVALSEYALRGLRAQHSGVLRIIGVFNDHDRELMGAATLNYRKLGTIEDLIELARNVPIDSVVLTGLSADNKTRLPKTSVAVLKKIWVLPVEILIDRATTSTPLQTVFDRPLGGLKGVAKSFVDKVIGTILIAISTPVTLVIAIAVKIDSRGPLLSKTICYGLNKRRIVVHRFRTVYVDNIDADADKMAGHEFRITRVGKVIRKMSLDALPQLFDLVFQGNLSLVGPQPDAVDRPLYLSAENAYNYLSRLRVKPGLTGWAQIHGFRNNDRKSEAERLDHDMYYVDRWSVLLDLYILLQTLIPFRIEAKIPVGRV